MGRARVYLETTVPSYLTARPSRDLIRAARQQLTRDWWSGRAAFELFVSELVVEECRLATPRPRRLAFNCSRGSRS